MRFTIHRGSQSFLKIVLTFRDAPLKGRQSLEVPPYNASIPPHAEFYTESFLLHLNKKKAYF